MFEQNTFLFIDIYICFDLKVCARWYIHSFKAGFILNVSKWHCDEFVILKKRLKKRFKKTDVLLAFFSLYMYLVLDQKCLFYDIVGLWLSLFYIFLSCAGLLFFRCNDCQFSSYSIHVYLNENMKKHWKVCYMYASKRHKWLIAWNFLTNIVQNIMIKKSLRVIWRSDFEFVTYMYLFNVETKC